MTVRGSTVLALARQARGRLLGNALLAEGANAFAAALIALIVLLLLGTEILNWRWALPIPLAAAAVGVYRARKRLPSLYSTAQIVDRRMGLADTVSTALFYGANGERGGLAEVREWQFREAERVSRSVDIRRAVPYTMPRSAYAVGALFLVASSLFALRYAVTKRLDLKPPLARILQLNLPLHIETEQAKAVRPDPPPPEPSPEQDAALSPEDHGQSRDGRPEAGGQNQKSASNSKDKNGKRDSEDARRNQKDQQAGEQEGEQDGQKDNANRQAQNGNGSSPQDGSGQQNQGQQQAAGQQQGSGENSSLMNKVKDAVQNLLSRMKPQQGSQGSQSGAQSAQNGNQGKGQQNGAKSQSGKQGGQQGQQNGQGNESHQGDADRMAQDSPNGQGKAAGDSDQQASKQPGSGIGSQDGNKEIKQAEQMAAMGKITEILGKRAADLSGEATVEVQSSNQHLRTPYAQRTAQHTEGGAEIGRDEVPVALQAYVEQYFEQVRKAKKK